MGLFGPNVEKLKANGDVIGLIKALGYTRDARVRTAAAHALGKIGDSRVVETLIGSLRDKDWMVRAAASEALGDIGDERAVEPLMEAFYDESESYRRDAAQALGKIGDKRAVESLINALQDTLHVRICAAQALGEIGDQRAVEPLIEALKSWHIGYVGAKDAGVALGKIGDKRGMEVLRAFLKDPEESLRLAAADSLLEIGELDAGADVEGYFIVEPPDGDGGCDDNDCPCTGFAPIHRGKGYLYIPGTVVRNRRNLRKESDVKDLENRKISVSTGSLGATVLQQGVYYPILCCEQGARLRRLDLQVAAQDAAFWWETGLVPLRKTPIAH